MTERETIFVPGTPRLAVDHAGTGPLVLFLHGIGGNRSNRTEQVDACSGRFHAAAWDARGCSDSDDYPGPLGDFARDVLRVMDHFGERKTHLTGLGGRIAQDFYTRFPDRVATLALCDTMSDFTATFNAALLDTPIAKTDAPALWVAGGRLCGQANDSMRTWGSTHKVRPRSHRRRSARYRTP